MEFIIRTNKREEMVDITDKVFVPHASVGIIVNENADKWLKILQ